MDNAGTPEKPHRVSPPATDDIPIALREVAPLGQKPKFSRPGFVIGIGAVAVLALLAGGLVALRLQATPDVGATSNAAAPPSPAGSPDDRLLNHYAYPEAPTAELAAITADGSIKMRLAAASAFKSMVAAAQADGISLVPISGFRSIADQKYLYFDVKAERRQTASERAQVSAPPGYSEHHTGYAVDIGDANLPATHLREDFDETAAYRWLKENAARYSFELSFPKKNRQGVSYEPWHWRFAGDIQSLKTFYKAREQKTSPSDSY